MKKYLQFVKTNPSILAVVVAIAFVYRTAPFAAAQSGNLPPPGAYQPIPNYTGTNAGLLFRQAINNRFSGVQPISPTIVDLSFSNLPTEVDGALFYCLDCEQTKPCAGGGPGAWAFGQNGAWNCIAGASNYPMSGDVGGTTGANTVNSVQGGKTPVVTSGANTASGIATAAALNGFNVASQVNASNPVFGVLSTSSSTEGATTTAGSTSVALNAIGPFQVGMGVLLPHAGPTPSVTAPTGLAGNLASYSLNPNPTAGVGPLYAGSCNVDSSNASCTTSYSAVVMAVDANGGLSPASSVVTVANGPATLSVNNSVYWKWTCEANAPAYVVLGCTGASCTPTAIWATVPARVEGEPCDFWDFGNHFGNDLTYGSSISTGVQATGANQDLSAKITAVSGNTITLATAPSVSGTFIAYVDNAPVINAAIQAVANGGDVLLPAANGAYNISQLNFFNTDNVHFGGNSIGFWGASGANIGTTVNYVGSIGRPFIYMNWAPGAAVHDFYISSNYTSPGIINYIDADPWVTGGNQRSKGNEIYHEKIGAGPNVYAGSFATIGANSTGGEVEFVNIHDNQASAIGYIGIEVNSGWQSDNTEIDRNELGTFNVVVQGEAAGTINEKNNDSSSPYIYHRVNNYIKQWNLIGEYSDGECVYWMYDGAGDSHTKILVEGSNVASTPGPNGYGVLSATPETWVNNTFSCNGSNNCLVGISYPTAGVRTPTFIGNVWLALYPASLPSSIEPPYALPITDGGGVNQIPRFVSIGDAITINGTAYPVGEIFNGEPGVTLNQTPLNLTPASQTANGTSGSANCSMSLQGTLKVVTCYLNAYSETGTAQTVCFNGTGCTVNLAGVNFSTNPAMIVGGATANSCGTYNPGNASSTVLTLPANASMTGETCNIILMGQ